MSPKRLVFLHTTGEMGGVEFSTLFLTQTLDIQRWQVLVVMPRRGTFAHSCQEQGIPIEIVPLPRNLPTSLRFSLLEDMRIPNPLAWIWNAFTILFSSIILTRWLRSQPVDLLVTKGLSAHIYGGLAARWSGVPCLWHVQDLISQRYAGLYAKTFAWIAARLPSRLVADGSPILDQLSRYQPLPSHSLVVLNGVDTNLFYPRKDSLKIRLQLELPSEALVIGHIARLTPWKGQHHLLAAFNQIAGAYPHIHLLLVGSALFESDDFEQLLHLKAKEFGLEERVTFTGYRPDLPNVLAAIDLFAYPSLEKDTSPLSLQSAMACGLPVIAYDLPGVREVVADAGLLVPVGDISALSGVMGELISDPEKRQRLSIASRQRAESAFSLLIHTQAMENVFDEMIPK